ncbi:MAG: class I SAM-dependent methyltransferase [Planctomycetota bacterium]|jgi:tRNA (cmo5U34)-methyltransferase
MNENNMNQADRFNDDKSTAYDELIKKIIPTLVAGCGTGKEIIDYSTNNSHWQFLGFDPSEKMLQMAKERLQVNNCLERVRLIKGVIDDVIETEFDAATTILVIQFLPSDEEIQRFLNKISAKLKPAAPLILVYMEGNKETNEYSILNSAWLTQQFRTRNDDQAVIDEFKQRDKETRFVSQKQIESYLDKAGFSNPIKFYQAYLLTGRIAFKK